MTEYDMKRDLYFSKPLMNAAGSLGFAPDTRLGIPLDLFGAFVTNPFSLRPRLPAARPDVIEHPGGFLLHTGLPNPGFTAGLKKYSANSQVILQKNQNHKCNYFQFY